MFDINGWEFILLLVLAVVVLGPERLPTYAEKLAHLVKRGRMMAERAQSQLKEEMGPEFSEIDWKAYDPRQYDPRKIVREALLDGPSDQGPAPEEPHDKPVNPVQAYDPSRPTPWDADAT